MLNRPNESYELFFTWEDFADGEDVISLGEFDSTKELMDFVEANFTGFHPLNAGVDNLCVDVKSKTQGRVLMGWDKFEECVKSGSSLPEFDEIPF